MTPERAKEILGDTVREDGSLYNLGWYVSWNKTRKRVVLDGEFGIEDLEAIAQYLRDHHLE